MLKAILSEIILCTCINPPIRFMICCDQCEEWYHGDCVGISVGQGKRMEREGKEYVCPVCIARMKDAKEEREINRYAVEFFFNNWGVSF